MKSTPDITSASDWADALDAHQKETGSSAGEIISTGYADGQILGVTLDSNHPDADEERAVIASEGGWVVRYVPQSDWWEAVPA
jgi:hypothetical protein